MARPSVKIEEQMYSSQERKIRQKLARGKRPLRLLDAASKSNNRSILLAGALTDAAKNELSKRYGAQVYARAITPKNMPLADALTRGPENLELAAQSASREAIGSAQ